MEGKIMLEIANQIDSGKKVALVTLTNVDGSSPGKNGSIMGVFSDGSTLGTIGGGDLEFKVINSAIEAMKKDENMEFNFDLVPSDSFDMRCGGKIKGYIKVFQRRKKLIILGGGHLGVELYKFGKLLNMYTVIIDDREEYASKDRFPKSDELLVGDIEQLLKNYNTNKNSYIVIITRGHLGDKKALKIALEKDSAYVGMIGSRKKVTQTFEELLLDGIPKEKLLEVFSPIGLDISNSDPNEIAFGIMAEILKIKNNRSGKHMKEVKNIKM